MYKLDCYLNQDVQGEVLMRVGDIPILEITAYDADGTIWDDLYDATLVVRRATDHEEGEIVITMLTEVSPGDDNVFYFSLEDVNFEEADYEAHLVLEDTALTISPVSVSPEYALYTFESFAIKVGS